MVLYRFASIDKNDLYSILLSIKYLECSYLIVPHQASLAHFLVKLWYFSFLAYTKSQLDRVCTFIPENMANNPF